MAGRRRWQLRRNLPELGYFGMHPFQRHLLRRLMQQKHPVLHTGAREPVLLQLLSLLPVQSWELRGCC